MMAASDTVMGRWTQWLSVILPPTKMRISATPGLR